MLGGWWVGRAGPRSAHRPGEERGFYSRARGKEGWVLSRGGDSDLVCLGLLGLLFRERGGWSLGTWCELPRGRWRAPGGRIEGGVICHMGRLGEEVVSLGGDYKFSLGYGK